MGNIKIFIGTFGEKRSLTRIFNTSELSEKTVKDILEMMIEEEWDGKDKIASCVINNEMGTSHYYSVARKIQEKPIRYEPILLDKPIKEYEQNGEIKLEITGSSWH